MKNVRLLGPIVAVIIPYLAYEILRLSSFDATLHAPHGHFYIVSVVSALATVVGIAIGIIGSRLRNTQVSFLSLAFISLAGVFTLHGLTTPGFLHEAGQLPGIAAQFSVILATCWLWLSSLSADHVIVRSLSKWKHLLVPVWSIFLIIVCSLAMFYPEVADYVPFTEEPMRSVVVVIVILLNSYTIYSYYQSYRYSKFPLQIAIVYSACWFIVAQIIIARGEVWLVSWWLYHFLLLASMIAMVWGLIRQYGLNRSLAKTVQALYTTDPAERIASFLPHSVRTLIMSVETKDIYTAGHNFRVTLYALRIAEQMGLTPEQCRAVVTGTIVHDVGKIRIPDEILNKPERLTDEERQVIEQHPIHGYEMCKNLGFMQDELKIIRSHHERMDGRGYPDGLMGREIPLMARIVAVADVYDALTSERAYRQAWSHEETLQYLYANKDTHFDPEVVEAWVQACERDARIYQDASLGVHLFSAHRHTSITS